MSISETQYKNFGKCVELRGGGLKALITVGIGPRIIYYGTDDGRNVFFEDVSREVKRDGAYFDKNFESGETWYLYGGHRMWKSPEDDATYVPDNYAVEYEIQRNTNQNEKDDATYVPDNYAVEYEIKTAAPPLHHSHGGEYAVNSSSPAASASNIDEATKTTAYETTADKPTASASDIDKTTKTTAYETVADKSTAYKSNIDKPTACASNIDKPTETVVFIQPVQENTGLRFRLEVSMDKKGALKVRHVMKNIGANAVTAAIWGISVLKGGGFLAVPLNTSDTGFLPNNNFSFWPYDDMNDKRLSFVGGYLVLKHAAAAEKPFKIALNCKKQAVGVKNAEKSFNSVSNCEKQTAAYFNDGLIFVKSFNWQNGAVYPDGNCNFETYTSALFTELEALSPIFSVAPNQSVEHNEEFFIFKQDLTPDEKSLNDFFKKPI
jgi:hypothetical protein